MTLLRSGHPSVANPSCSIINAALHTLAAQKQGAETAPTLAPAAADLDTDQPQAIAFDAKELCAVDTCTQHLRRDSADRPIGVTRSQRMVDGVHKAQGGGYHRRCEVALN